MKQKIVLKICMCLALWIVFATSVSANVMTVDSTNDSGLGSLRQAVIESLPGDTILFSTFIDGDTITLTSGSISLNKNLVLIGNDSTNTIIDGNANGAIFSITGGVTISLHGLRIQNGGGTLGGGITNLGVLTVSNCFITGSNASLNGGGIASISSGITLINSRISGNTASSWGGGMYTAGSDNEVTVINCTISGNTSGSRGGAVHNNTIAAVTFEDCHITNNMSSTSGGGGVYNSGSSLSVQFTGSTITGNVAAGGPGGGVYNNGIDSVSFSDCLISGNTTTSGSGGGGVYSNGVSVNLFSNCYISGNTATTFGAPGGGVLMSGSYAVFDHCNITGNETLNFGVGGGIGNISNSQSTLTDCQVTSNSANSGGGVYIGSNAGDTLVFINGIIAGNTATNNSGGGVYSLGTGFFTNTVLSGNTAAVLGGGFLNDGGKAAFINATITGNTSLSNAGGGVCNLFGASPTVIFGNSIVAKNSDDGSGPDIYNPFGILTDNGHNLIGDTTGAGDQFSLSTLLGSTGNIFDPLFVQDLPPNDSLGGDLTLQLQSPAINVGDAALNPLPTDLNGNDRVAGCEIDLGAYEYQDLASLQTFVTNTDDAGCGSLRQAVSDAMIGDTIRFSEALDGDTIQLATGQILLNKDLVILGNDTGKTIVDAQSNSRVFEVTAGDSIVIKSMSLINGSASDGGGIYNNGDLTLRNVALIGNNASTRGGGLFNNISSSSRLCNTRIAGNSAANRGGGLYNIAISSLSMDSCVISDNTCSFGGGLYNEGNCPVSCSNSSFYANSATSGQGGGIYNAGNSTGIYLANCSLAGNSAYNGGAIFNTSSGSMATFTDCALIGNHTIFVSNQSNNGGAIFNSSNTTIHLINTNVFGNAAPDGFGGGIYNSSNSSNLFLSRTTIAGNEAQSGAGITNSGNATFTNSVFSGNHTLAGNGSGGGFWNRFGGKTKIINSTFSGNIAVFGGGIYDSGDSLTFINTIIANNTAPNDRDIRSSGVIVDLGYNLIGDSSGVANQFPNTTLKGGPGNLLDPLFNENVPANDSLGGYLSLQCNSPAIDEGTPDTTGLNLGPVDRNGSPRLIGPAVDIGAYESPLFQQSLFVDNALLALYGESGTYTALDSLQSDAVIKSNNSILFRAGTEIFLLPNFKVELGATFKTNSDGCEED